MSHGPEPRSVRPGRSAGAALLLFGPGAVPTAAPAALAACEQGVGGEHDVAGGRVEVGRGAEVDGSTVGGVDGRGLQLSFVRRHGTSQLGRQVLEPIDIEGWLD